MTERELDKRYQEARALVAAQQFDAACLAYRSLLETPIGLRQRAIIENDLGVLDMLAGDWRQSRTRFAAALELDPLCDPAQANLRLLEQSVTSDQRTRLQLTQGIRKSDNPEANTPLSIALLSFFFNWPSTGGGIIHTVELAQFLSRAGYEVHLIYPRFTEWSIGNVDDTCPVSGRALEFDTASWTLSEMKKRFRQTVDEITPDYVIITDSWNIKPHLADAVRDYPYLLRLQAMECICPLNNLRLLPSNGEMSQCPKSQLDDPDDCLSCLKVNGDTSGALHRVERALSEVWAPEYRRLLQQTFREAEAVLALNTATARLHAPHCNTVRVVTWGMNPGRFPPLRPKAAAHKVKLLFAD